MVGSARRSDSLSIMSPSAAEQVTAILLEADGPTRDALDRLLPVIYDDLRAIAHGQLAGDPAPTLSTTALVHEAYLRLADDPRITARGRAYFFAAAARAMRRIVVEYARRQRRLKRGGGARFLPLDEDLAPGIDPRTDILDIERGLNELANLTERPARVVECRFFAGLSVEDTALALGVTTRTVKRDWAFARAWLFNFLRGLPGPEAVS
jgi:RNA polymerase sigma factor (TIGR02999 family)